MNTKTMTAAVAARRSDEPALTEQELLRLLETAHVLADAGVQFRVGKGHAVSPEQAVAYAAGQRVAVRAEVHHVDRATIERRATARCAGGSSAAAAARRRAYLEELRGW